MHLLFNSIGIYEYTSWQGLCKYIEAQGLPIQRSLYYINQGPFFRIHAKDEEGAFIT